MELSGFYLTDALCNYLTRKPEILQPINRKENHMRNLEEDKKWLESVFGHYGHPLDFSEEDIIARHAIDRAIAAESKLEIAVKALIEIKAYTASVTIDDKCRIALEDIKRLNTNTEQTKVVEHCIHGLAGFCINCIDEEDRVEGFR
jgi:hypothetical protein